VHESHPVARELGLCVCLLGTSVSCVQTALPIKIPSEADSWVQGTIVRWGQDPQWEGAFCGGHLLVHCYVPMHECIALALGDCACPLHTAWMNAFAAESPMLVLAL